MIANFKDANNSCIRPEWIPSAYRDMDKKEVIVNKEEKADLNDSHVIIKAAEERLKVSPL